MRQKGLAPVVIIILVAILLISCIAFIVGRPKDQVSPFQNFQQGHDNKVSSKTDWPLLWGPPDTACENKKDVKFSTSPIDVKDILVIEPIGELREGHIMPGDHGGFNYKTSPTSAPVKVLAPADGFLVRVEKHPYQPPAGYPNNIQHYHVYLEHSCTLFTGIVHLTEFAPEILAASEELEQLTKYRGTEQKQSALRIPIRAGQQLGTAWSFGLLGWVAVDLTHTNKGYLNPESYKGENWRVHSVAGLDYFEQSLKDQLMVKNPRTLEPKGGKIDFDTVGKLSGGWFEQGTGGFRDERVEPKQCGNFPCPYWDGHIAFVYDYVDPVQLRVSVGHNWGLSERTPYGVKGNSPDFAGIGVENGLVKYELVGLKDISRDKGYDTEGGSALVTVNDETKMPGTMLVQMMNQNTIKVEIFPGMSKERITDFTSKAKVYQR